MRQGRTHSWNKYNKVQSVVDLCRVSNALDSFRSIFVFRFLLIAYSWRPPLHLNSHGSLPLTDTCLLCSSMRLFYPFALSDDPVYYRREERLPGVLSLWTPPLWMP